MKPVNPADFIAYFEYSVLNFNVMRKIFYSKIKKTANAFEIGYD